MTDSSSSSGDSPIRRRFDSNDDPSTRHFNANDDLLAFNHNDAIMERMYEYFKLGKLCDVILLAENVEIKAHRIVLSAASDYFATMFTSGLIESRSETIRLNEVNGEALKNLVEFAYTGGIKITTDNVESTMHAASLFRLSQVLKECCHFLKGQFDASNCLGIEMIADSVSCSKLQNSASVYSREHFMEVIENEEFLMLSHKDLGKYLTYNDINVPSEMSVFYALIKWVNHDRDSRKKHLPTLLKCVKLALLPPVLIYDNIIPELNDSAEKDSVIEALQCHLIPERNDKVDSYQLTPRKSTIEKVYACGGAPVEPKLRGLPTLEAYDPKKEKWSQFSFEGIGLHGQRLQNSVAAVDGVIYVAGGRNGLRTLSTVESYNTITNATRRCPNLSTPRHGLGLAAILPKGPLYAVGGHDGWSYLSSVERWMPGSKEWQHVTTLSCPRSAAGVAVLDNKIYVVGGRDNVSCLNSVEVYDTHTNAWTYVAPMNKRRSGVGVTVLNGFIYALGGHDFLPCASGNPASIIFSCAERYDPKTNVWTYIASMNYARDGLGATLLGNKIMAAGGFDGGSHLSLVEVYDPCKDEWEEIAPMVLPRAGPCVIARVKNESHLRKPTGCIASYFKEKRKSPRLLGRLPKDLTNK